MTSVLGHTTCAACKRRMADTEGCTDLGYPFVIDGQVQWLRAIPYGDDREGWENPTERCHDCAALIGQVHHWGCDVARCPNCLEQFLGCECDMPESDNPRPDNGA